MVDWYYIYSGITFTVGITYIGDTHNTSMLHKLFIYSATICCSKTVKYCLMFVQHRLMSTPNVDIRRPVHLLRKHPIIVLQLRQVVNVTNAGKITIFNI